MNSAYGCPLECPRGGPDGFVCSNNGVCAYDGLEDGLTVDGDKLCGNQPFAQSRLVTFCYRPGAKGEARCLCKSPYGGDDCASYAVGAGVVAIEYAHGVVWWVGVFAIVLVAGWWATRRGVLAKVWDRLATAASGLASLAARDDRAYELVAGAGGYQAAEDGEDAAFIKDEAERERRGEEDADVSQ